MNARHASFLRWTALALVGLAIAVAVGVAAGKLTSQRIGLSSEPLKAGEALAPKAGEAHNGNPGGKPGGGGDGGNDTPTPPTTTTTVQPQTTTTPTTESEGSDDDADEDDD